MLVCVGEELAGQFKPDPTICYEYMVSRSSLANRLLNIPPVMNISLLLSILQSKTALRLLFLDWEF